MKITAAQIQRIHALLAKTGLMAQKGNLVLGVSQGQQTSTKELTASQADEFIAYLEGKHIKADAANTMRRKILAMAHRLHWTLGNGKVDMQRVNEWCKTKSYLLKPLNDYTQDELAALVSQFQKVYRYYITKTT